MVTFCANNSCEDDYARVMMTGYRGWPVQVFGGAKWQLLLQYYKHRSTARRRQEGLMNVLLHRRKLFSGDKLNIFCGN